MFIVVLRKMKRFSNKIRLFLLFTFAFFVMHDYVILGVDADTQNELCYNKQGVSFENSLDFASQIHEQIHVLLNAPLAETITVSLEFAEIHPFAIQACFTSHIHFVLQRPPLS